MLTNEFFCKECIVTIDFVSKAKNQGGCIFADPLPIISDWRSQWTDGPESRLDKTLV